MKQFLLTIIVGGFTLSACQSVDPSAKKFDKPALSQALSSQTDAVKARYGARHPTETLEFFGIAPGMTVLEALPGGGWYTKILLPYLGPEGRLEAGHYPDDMWKNIRADKDWIAARVEDTRIWPEKAAGWNIENAASIGSFSFSEMPSRMDGTVDAVLFIRTLHTLNQFEEKTGYFSATVSDAYRALKPGGVLGVVQHRAPVAKTDAWANGSHGYLKQDYMIKAFEDAGFIFEAASEINANPNDKPTADDVVWRLPPTLATTKENTPERAAILAIGESDRMTLRFRKPG
ncbi:MAG: methyltransferase [Robiginitomaculum sp.]|nr:methyltransferase [Robiginitomaculum sp.]